ncbi:MAG: HD domain-containing phosphohydrolase [Campylobacterota bacterium]
MRFSGIKVKIFTLIFLTVIALAVALWLVMINMLKDISQKNQLQLANQEFVQLDKNFKKLKQELDTRSNLITQDEEVQLLVNLLDKYQDKTRYYKNTFDIQKFKLADILHKYQKLSQSSQLIVYDTNGELLAFSSLQNSGILTYDADANAKLLNKENASVANTFPSMHDFTQELLVLSNADGLYASKLQPIYNDKKKVGYLLSCANVGQLLFKEIKNQKFTIALGYKDKLYFNNAQHRIDKTVMTTQEKSESTLQQLQIINNNENFIYSYLLNGIEAYYIASKGEYFQTLKAMQVQLLVLVILVTLAIALISYIFTQKIFITPFKKLFDGFKHMQEGNYTHSIKVDSDDEIRQLADAFNTMSAKIEKNDREKTKNYEEVIEGLVDIIEQRDTYTAGHSKRVAKYCELLARALGYEEHTVQKLIKAAMLHDIGKIQTPDNILLKPAKLTPLEYKLIQEHVSVSDFILDKLTMYQELAHIVKYHHERYDGKGYPYGLKGEDIPKLSRIMIVADAFDAMTTNRIYKPRMSIDQALKELQNNSGTQFDPQIVAVAQTALQDITLPQTSDQLPHTEIEKERFAYFFKDKLTQSYNIDYLNTVLNNDEFGDSLAYVIMLKNFSQYNERYGWKEGDKYLIALTHFITQLHPQNLLFRVEGDDFVLLGKSIELEDIKDFENDIISFDIICVSLHNVNSFDDIKAMLS